MVVNKLIFLSFCRFLGTLTAYAAEDLHQGVWAAKCKRCRQVGEVKFSTQSQRRFRDSYHVADLDFPCQFLCRSTTIYKSSHATLPTQYSRPRGR